MKGLLHSKLFKQNLSRWLFMYIAVICLATSVITYSRYISSLQGGEEARAAKFNVKVTSLDCEGEDIRICSQGDYRSTSKIQSHIRVQKDFEVRTTFVLSVKVNTAFNLNSISNGSATIDFSKLDIDNYNSLTEEEKTSLGSEKLSSIKKDDTYLTLTFVSTVPKGTNIATDYTIETEFKNTDTTDKEGYPETNTINIGYSATQID